ncbi:maleylpyruvate isomerase [Mumia flava]|uniref:Maleylpyruvate isomerase n=1 Tax=Mumia flava TaxID=1348852 RepID=A0A0B2BIF9_9ACTN|nr:maleylpyruvate isomerase family mycothiol-dependent enzyme [Mumia flava]PJJ53621.1 maleylpyruvate isomerase [Mumia flava]
MTSANATPHDVIDLVDSRTQALLTDLDALSADDLRAPCLLPGWTRAHLVTHLARNADALVNLFTWANTGVETRMYPSREQRDADIEAGAARSTDELLDDLTESSVRWIVTARSLPDEAWSAVIEGGAHSTKYPATWIPMMRAGEVIIHHTDLGTGYVPDQWPAGWVGLALRDAATNLSDRAGEPIALRATDSGLGIGDGGGRTVSGTQADLLAWVTGRATGPSLATVDGDLPTLGDWR